MVSKNARRRINFYLGVCLAAVSGAMMILNLLRGDLVLAGALAVLLVIVSVDLHAAHKGKEPSVSVLAILSVLGAVILLSVWRVGADLGFYVFPTIIGSYLAMPARSAFWYANTLIVGLSILLVVIEADTVMALRLVFALILCQAFLSFAVKRIVEARIYLENSVFLDPLTGCFNRRHLERVAQTEDLRKASLILFDLDFFKSINDTFGHPTGDFVLRAVTALVRQYLSPEDLFFRIGGEEFMVLRLNPQSGTTRELAEQCRQALEAAKILETRRVTATFSCAEFNGRTEIEPVLGQADVALLQAKRAGRNRVV